MAEETPANLEARPLEQLPPKAVETARSLHTLAEQIVEDARSTAPFANDLSDNVATGIGGIHRAVRLTQDEHGVRVIAHPWRRSRQVHVTIQEKEGGGAQVKAERVRVDRYNNVERRLGHLAVSLAEDGSVVVETEPGMTPRRIHRLLKHAHGATTVAYAAYGPDRQVRARRAEHAAQADIVAEEAVRYTVLDSPNSAPRDVVDILALCASAETRTMPEEVAVNELVLYKAAVATAMPERNLEILRRLGLERSLALDRFPTGGSLREAGDAVGIEHDQIGGLRQTLSEATGNETGMLLVDKSTKDGRILAPYTEASDPRDHLRDMIIGGEDRIHLSGGTTHSDIAGHHYIGERVMRGYLHIHPGHNDEKREAVEENPEHNLYKLGSRDEALWRECQPTNPEARAVLFRFFQTAYPSATDIVIMSNSRESTSSIVVAHDRLYALARRPITFRPPAIDTEEKQRLMIEQGKRLVSITKEYVRRANGGEEISLEEYERELLVWDVELCERLGIAMYVGAWERAWREPAVLRRVA